MIHRATASLGAAVPGEKYLLRDCLIPRSQVAQGNGLAASIRYCPSHDLMCTCVKPLFHSAPLTYQEIQAMHATCLLPVSVAFICMYTIMA